MRGETDPLAADAVGEMVEAVGGSGVEEEEGPLAPAPDGPSLPEGTIPIGAGRSDGGKGSVGGGGKGCREKRGAGGSVGLSGGW